MKMTKQDPKIQTSLETRQTERKRERRVILSLVCAAISKAQFLTCKQRMSAVTYTHPERVTAQVAFGFFLSLKTKFISEVRLCEKWKRWGSNH